MLTINYEYMNLSWPHNSQKYGAPLSNEETEVCWTKFRILTSFDLNSQHT